VADRPHERVGGDGGALPQRSLREVVEAWCAGAIAGEVKANEAEYSRIETNVISRQVEVWWDRSLPLLGPRPILAEQRPLLGQLSWVSAWEAHAVTGGEEQSRRRLAAHEHGEPLLGRLLGKVRLRNPFWLAGGQETGKWLDQFGGTEGSGAIVGVPRPEKRSMRRQSILPTL
jgi:hypothetical protein